MDIEEKLRKLEIRYRSASSAAAAAKASYEALTAEPQATAAARDQAKQRWQLQDERRRSISLQIDDLEALEDAGG
jgi:hypothetical protein